MSGAPASNDPDFRPRSAYSLLQSLAAKQPDQPAILSVNSPPLTYQGLLAQVNRTVATLNRHGIGRGDRVALVLPNGPDLAVAFLAVAAGAACAPLNAAYRGKSSSFTSLTYARNRSSFNVEPNHRRLTLPMPTASKSWS